MDTGRIQTVEASSEFPQSAQERHWDATGTGPEGDREIRSTMCELIIRSSMRVHRSRIRSATSQGERLRISVATSSVSVIGGKTAVTRKPYGIFL
jgi:hypothetical protein